MYRINTQNLQALYEAVSQNYDLFLPIETAGTTNFGLWHSNVQVDLRTLKTVKSPKDIFFPQSESLYTCSQEDGKLTVTQQERCKKPFVVFGIKACDTAGIGVLDRVFLSEPVDSYYASRRENGILVTLACNRPETSCFCGTFGIDCAAPGGDVETWLTGEFLYWLPKTPKGEALTEKLMSLLECCEEAPVTAVQEEIKVICERLPLKDLDVSRWTEDSMESLFDSPLWEQMYKPCLACGTCTFVCPTCQCYDIRDYDAGNGVQRYRCWDSCMYSDFTMMAHGNNRTSQMQRFRQRFMHKLSYFPANNGGMFSCVGCGRCVDKCPSHLNIVKVIKAFGKGEQ